MGKECEHLDCSMRGEAVSAATGGTCLHGGQGQETGSLARRVHQNVPFLARSGLLGEGGVRFMVLSASAGRQG